MTDSADKEGRIRDRAYAIWESEGGPDGHHERHWHQASRELEDDTGTDDAATASSADVTSATGDPGGDDGQPSGTAGAEEGGAAGADRAGRPNDPAYGPA